jgi:hypothetical protein
MENLLNYFYWQTLALNQFDQVGHLLRTANFLLPDCSNAQNNLRGPDMPHGSDAQKAIRDQCGSYTGPYQPGVNAPDPTENLDGGEFGSPASSASKSKAKSTAAPIKPTAPSKPGEQRGAGQPRALPLPGQRDPSVPHVVLPPALQQLLDQLRHGGAPDTGKGTPPLPQLPSGAGAPSGAPGGVGAGSAPDQMLDFLLSP